MLTLLLWRELRAVEDQYKGWAGAGYDTKRPVR